MLLSRWADLNSSTNRDHDNSVSSESNECCTTYFGLSRGFQRHHAASANREVCSCSHLCSPSQHRPTANYRAHSPPLLLLPVFYNGGGDRCALAEREKRRTGPVSNDSFDDAAVADLRRICVKSSNPTFCGTQIHAPKKVCHNGRIPKCPRKRTSRRDEGFMYPRSTFTHRGQIRNSTGSSHQLAGLTQFATARKIFAMAACATFNVAGDARKL